MDYPPSSIWSSSHTSHTSHTLSDNSDHTAHGNIQNNLGGIADEDLDDTEEYIYIEPEFNRHFQISQNQLEAIQTCIKNVSLPTYVNRPPSNLGEPTHGSLKAYELFILFSIIFPLIVPEFWHHPSSSPSQTILIRNFYNLVASTNIVTSFSTSFSEADAYMEHYVDYRHTMSALWENSYSRPNHHYAMHNGDLLKHWGPLAALSEFPGERINGILQKIKTNRRMCKYLFSITSIF